MNTAHVVFVYGYHTGANNALDFIMVNFKNTYLLFKTKWLMNNEIKMKYI